MSKNEKIVKDPVSESFEKLIDLTSDDKTKTSVLNFLIEIVDLQKTIRDINIKKVNAATEALIEINSYMKSYLSLPVGVVSKEHKS